MRILPAFLALVASLGLASGTHAATCPVQQSTPGFTAGGNVLGRIAAQWNSYWASKADANNGVLCNPTIINPSGLDTSFTLAPKLSNQTGARNTGTQKIVPHGELFIQSWVVQKATSYFVNTDFGGISDSGGLLIATGAAVTFTLPNPTSGTVGTSYQFGSDGTHGFTLTTAGGAALLYGCPGAGGTSVSFTAKIDVTVTDDGTGYKCTATSSQTPIVANNAALLATPTSFSGTLFRAGFIDAGDSGAPLFFTASASPCSLNGGNGDNGSQVKSADGLCWIAAFPSNEIDFRWFGLTASGDAVGPINAAFALGSNHTFVCTGGTYTIKSTTASPYPIVAGPVGLKLWGTSGAHLSNIKIKGDCVITADDTHNNSNWLSLDYIDHPDCCGGITFLANETGLPLQALPSAMIVWHLTDPHIHHINLTGNWGDVYFSGGSAIPAFLRGDWIIGGEIDNIYLPEMGQCIDLAFVRGLRIRNITAAGAGEPGNNSSIFGCISVAYDAPMQANYPPAAPYDFATTKYMTIGPGINATNYAQAVLLRAGSHYKIIGNPLHDNPGVSPSPYSAGVFLKYETAACCGSYLDPVTDVGVIGNDIADNGASVGGAGMLIDTSLSSGLVNAATWAATGGGQATFTMDVGHVVEAGQSFIISGMTPSGYNGTYTALSRTQGPAITAGSFIVGQSYIIQALGTTNFTLIGASSNTLGLMFTATGVGTGTGTASQEANVAALVSNPGAATILGAFSSGKKFARININGNNFDNNNPAAIQAVTTVNLECVFQGGNSFGGAAQTVPVGLAIVQSGCPPLTWIPVDATTTPPLPFTNVSAIYTLNDTSVHATVHFTFPSTPDTSNTLIAGLPFNAADANYAFGLGPCTSGTLGVPLLARTIPDTAAFEILNGNNNDHITNNLLSTLTIQCDFTYPAR